GGQARAGRDRGARRAQGLGRRRDPPARRRSSRRDGLLRERHHPRAAAEGEAGPDYASRRAREPRARRDHHAGSAELPDGVGPGWWMVDGGWWMVDGRWCLAVAVAERIPAKHGPPKPVLRSA